jgi:threonine/homoserine/homoserine lactone efflux protein
MRGPLSGKTVSAKLAGARMSALGWRWFVDICVVENCHFTPFGPPRCNGQPFLFLQAAGFQWLNPKGWAMSIAVTSQFIMVDFPLHSAVTVAVVFSIVGFWSTSCWAMLGRAIGKFLAQPARLIWFNRAMALMILCCIVF